MKRIEPKTKESLVKLNNVFLNENELKYIRSIQIKKSQKQLPLPHSHLVEIFKKRKSDRGAFQDCKLDEILSIIEFVSAHEEYYPTPIAGNLDFLDILVFEPENSLFRILNVSQDSCDDNFDEDKLLSYLKKAIKRHEYTGSSGIYIFFMLSLDRVTCKYGALSIPLAYTTLGCLIQNVTLLLSEKNFLSCIHFGEIDYFTMQYKESEYTLPCFLRVGKNEV